MINGTTLATDNDLITHKQTASISISSYESRLKSAQNLTLPLEEELSLLRQLNEFELGRSLLTNQGLNGEWTAYVIIHGPKKQLTHPLENWLIHKAPLAKATQERFQIFRQQLQASLQNGMTVASVPCGLMDDLLVLDYSSLEQVNLIGIDLDERSLSLARDNATVYEKASLCSFIKKDAWDLGIHAAYDILTSNGLNIYETDSQKVTALYKEFALALKPAGILITSFLTPPPTLSPESSWKNYALEDVIRQKAIFADILQAKWQAFRTEEETRQQLETAGLKILEVIYDSQAMFPTVIAQK
ncbi:MAG: hypothetical protein K0R76_1604 [Alphaproteobacteria bacterium]|jgi:ubiquinone/menaquinone biosynthesis C-methylase UbiE|nr:hypothetical protein [Alphaproteobacteria bacterium]